MSISKERKENICTIVLIVLVLGLSIALSEAHGLVGVWILLGTLMLILSIVFVNAIIIALTIKHEYSKKMESYINLLGNRLSETKTNTWLYSEEAIAEYERSVDCESIILLSPDLKNDSGDSKYVEMIKEVIQKGVKYCYIVPDTAIITSRCGDLRKIFANNLKQLKIITLPQNEFNSLTTTTVVIYQRATSTEKTVFIELPVFDGSHWWAVASKEQGDIFVGKMHGLLKRNKKSI